MIGNEVVQSFDGFLGPVFLDETHRHNDGHSDGDTDSIIHISHENGSPSRGKQQKNQWFLELS